MGWKRSGQLQTGFLLTTLHSAFGPQALSQGFWHLPPAQIVFTGQSASPLGHWPSGRHPPRLGSPTNRGGHLQTGPSGATSQMAEGWQVPAAQPPCLVQATSGSGSPRNPGGQWHTARWSSAKQIAFSPQDSSSQTSKQVWVIRLHIWLGGQSWL